jgi:hypothetical protein
MIETWMIVSGIASLFIAKEAVGSYQNKKQLRLKAAEEESRRKLLENLSATVYVREPNGSRTNLEHHIEQELISRGARVLVSNQNAGMSLIKHGDFKPLHPEAHFSVIGNLVVRSGIFKEEIEWIEGEYDFRQRKEAYKNKVDRWYDRGGHLYSSVGPKPVLEARKSRVVNVPAIHFQFSFRLVGRDGALLVSGTCEEFPLASEPSHEGTLKQLASEAISHLDESDVWTRIVIE